ncbi:MAG: 4-hydroxy-tetrahydrodipicolinate synthase [Gammaproteobacteria bacterium]|nr:4-hydroxy-tetrahydrodipicolinate synthase [Gammaproteobacteria bacterium]
MFQGSIVALVTPMGTDGTIDNQSLAELVDFHLKSATDAILIVGTTGESATLNEKEHCTLIARAVDLAAGRLPVIAGTGANSTTEAITLTHCAREAGADACLLVTPYYNKPTQEGLYLHYRAVAEAVDIPQILYNVPGRTACDMLPETVARLAELDNIIGIKEATGDISRITEILDRTNNDFPVYSGDDITALEAMHAGAKGVISVTANVAPAAVHELCSLALTGERDRAIELNRQLMPLHEAMFVESNPIPAKWALHEMGMIPAGLRLPLTPLSDKHHETVRQALRQSKIIR